MKKIISIFVTLFILLTISGCVSSTISGKVASTPGAHDDELLIETDAPVLIRSVEMVQYLKDDNGNVNLVLANYPIESFEGYENPEFNLPLDNRVFYGEIKLNDEVLSGEQVKSLVYSNETDFTRLHNLPTSNGHKYNLVLKDDAYITASDDWNLGDIRITYYTLEFDDTKDYSVIKNTD